MNAFLTDGKLITDKNDIRDMWANHVEGSGKPSVSPSFNHDFFDQVTTRVRNVFCIMSKRTALYLKRATSVSGSLNVCSKLKPGVSVVLINYELWRSHSMETSLWRSHSMETTSRFILGIFQ